MDKEAIKKARGERLILSLSAMQKCPCAECRIRCRHCYKRGRSPLKLPPRDLIPSNYDDWCDSCFVEADIREKFRRTTPQELLELKENQRKKREERLKFLEQKEAEKAARKAQRKKAKSTGFTPLNPEQETERETARDTERKRNWEEQRQKLEAIWDYNPDD